MPYTAERQLTAMHKFAADQVREMEAMASELAVLRDYHARRLAQLTAAGRKSAKLRSERAKAKHAEAVERTIAAARGANFRPRDEVVAGIRNS